MVSLHDIIWPSRDNFRDPLQLRAESLSQRLEQLWDEERMRKAELRFGNRDHIVARARVEERLERAA